MSKEFNYKIAFYTLVGFIIGGLVVFSAIYIHDKNIKKSESSNIISNNKKVYEKKEEKKYEENKKNDIKKAENSNVVSNITSNSKNVSETINKELTGEDNKVISYLKDKLENVSSNMTKENAKNLFIEVVDFLFYDGEIKGNTFSSLTAKGKMEATKLCTSIEIAIEKKFPGAIDETKDKYIEKKNKIIDKYNELINNYCSSKSDICDSFKSSYEQMKESFSNTFKYIKDIGEKTKDKLNNWYSNIKNN